MPRTLAASLNRTFKAPRERKPDIYRKQREEAKKLAVQHGIEIERKGLESGMNVWPFKGFKGIDPYEEDHYAGDWDEALTRVRAYVNGN